MGEVEKKWYVLSDEQKKNASEHKVRSKARMEKRLTATIDLAINENIGVCIHGHKHSKEFFDENVPWGFLNVSMEVIGFAPIRMAQVFEMIEGFKKTEKKEKK